MRTSGAAAMLLSASARTDGVAAVAGVSGQLHARATGVGAAFGYACGGEAAWLDAPALREHTGHAPQPCAASTCSATAICCSRLAPDAEPLPP